MDGENIVESCDVQGTFDTLHYMIVRCELYLLDSPVPSDLKAHEIFFRPILVAS